MAKPEQDATGQYRLIVVGGHTRSIGKTQLVCDLITALRDIRFTAGKITQYGHGVCAQNGEHCGCAPDEHSSAFEWETNAASGTDSSRFLAAGAARAFWLRTKQGYLAEGLPLLRDALKSEERETDSSPANVLVESNSLLHFLKPSVYLAILDPLKEDFKPTAQSLLDRADAFILRHEFSRPVSPWPQISVKLLQGKPSFLQREGDPLPIGLLELVNQALTRPAFQRI
ncbi:MAG TPA: hypothetical protein VKT53_05275 [Candidatus Acidoferrum sp.]|nr:hypothetical protein [Candidatus Acidoferrum sp.]